MDSIAGSEFIEAHQQFSEESGIYCRGINDQYARQYALEYVRMLEQRVQGLEIQTPKRHHALFAPSQRLISTALERIYTRHFEGR